MPVSAGTVQFSYTGDGTTTVFPFPSRFLSNSDIIVGVDGIAVTTGFTVTGQGAEVGGNVTFAAAPTTGQAITLIRAPAINQLLDFVNNQTVLAQNIDNGLDKLTIVAQYLNYLLERTLRLDQFDTGLTGGFDVGNRRLKNGAAPIDGTDFARLADLQGVVAGTGNVPSPTIGQIGYTLRAIAAGLFGWVDSGNPLASDGTLAAPGYGFANETNTGFLRPSAGVLQAAVLGVLRAELSASAFRLLVPLLSTNATVTAGTNAQGQAPMTADQNTVTAVAANPGGVTLPTAAAGRWITVVNRGANPVNIYPAAGAAIGALATNAPLLLGVNQVVEFFARSTTQWETQLSQPLDATLTALAALDTSTGVVVQTGTDTFTKRTITSTGGTVTITNPGGVAGNINLEAAGAWTYGTPVVTTSGTAFDFTGLPAGVSEIEIMPRNVSLSGSDNLIIQAIVSGAPVTTGYDSYSGGTGAGLSAVGSGATSGFVIALGASARYATGVMRLSRYSSGNIWNSAHSVAGGGSGAFTGGGDVSLAGALEGIRFTRSGASTFDLGEVNIRYR